MKLPWKLEWRIVIYCKVSKEKWIFEDLLVLRRFLRKSKLSVLKFKFPAVFLITAFSPREV